MLTYPEWKARRRRYVIEAVVMLVGLLTLCALAICSGSCAHVDDVKAAVEAAVQRPAIEVTVHAGDAAKVRALASKGHGTLDLAAVTIGSVIFYIDAAPSEELRRHEFCHVLQLRREGVLFPVNYWTENALMGYAGSKYERECYAVETDVNAPTADADR